MAGELLLQKNVSITFTNFVITIIVSDTRVGDGSVGGHTGQSGEKVSYSV